MNALEEYRQLAMQHAVTEKLEGDEGYAAKIPGFSGLIVFGETEQTSLVELASALEGWIEISLRKGHGLPEITEIAPALSV